MADVETKAVETTGTTETESKATETETKAKETETKKPTYEELENLLKEQTNAYTKLKASFDRASSDLSAVKKDLKARKSAEELAEETQKEKDQKLAIYEGIERYQNLYPDMDSETAKKIVKMDIDGDKDGVAETMREFIEALVKKKSQDALYGRGRVNAGTGTSKPITKDQFDAMSLKERSELYTTNRDEYERLKNLK